MRELLVKKVNHISVARLYEILRLPLGLHLLNSPTGLSRPIYQPAINRPGLALAGYYGYYAHERIQVFGNAEVAYLTSLQGEDRRARLEHIFSYDDVPCIIFSRGAEVPADMIEIADKHGVCIFVTPHPTMFFANRATILLEQEFADSTTIHGCMVNVRGVGVLLTGKGGIGKSEISLGLVERGASLVADDMVCIRNIGGDLITSSPKLSSGFIEIRGLGIVNVTNLFGLKAYSREAKLHLIINLTTEELSEIERLGLDRQMTNILGVDVERLNLPVAPGRDMSRLVEVAALGYYLRGSGYDMAGEFNRRLHKEISNRSKRPKP